jgi:hypothetical protein
VAAADPRKGSLTIVGTGIRPGLQTTPESRARIRHASKVLYLLAEDAPTAWIHELAPTAESLAPLYQPGKSHASVYQAIVDRVLDLVRSGEDVCLVSYGHPSVFDASTHDAVARARQEGFAASVLPAISALDCLFVDLELDPGARGLQSYEASEFIASGRTPDTRVPLILWQISVIGMAETTGQVNPDGLGKLAARLGTIYGPEHEVIVYEATPFPAGRPHIAPTPLSRLERAEVTGMSTLYVPPLPA